MREFPQRKFKLSNSRDTLIAKARAARASAYAPYSNFSVGAAVIDDQNRISSGCNIENASYGLTCCAERVAIFSAIAQGAKKIVELALSCPPNNSANTGALMPCGACRQVMQEFMDEGSQVHIDGVGTLALSELLPNPFRL